MMYTMPKNLLSICVNFALATQQKIEIAPPVSYTDTDFGYENDDRDC